MRRSVLLCAAGVAAVAGSAIDIAVDEKKRLSHMVDSLDLLLYVCLMILTIVTVWIFKYKRVRFLHESGLAIFYGLVVGGILRALGSTTRNVTHLQVYAAKNAIPQTGPSAMTPLLEANADTISPLNSLNLDAPPDTLLLAVNLSEPRTRSESEDGRDDMGISQKTFAYSFKDEFTGAALNRDDMSENSIQEKATFNPELFFYVLLPPIIFHAGYSMRKKAFFDNFGAIAALALVGTTISTGVIAAIMYGFAQFISIEVKFVDTLYFGAIVSATDPITVLTIFQDLHVDSMLNGLVLGESLLNDAVAIVLCSSIEEYAKVSQTKGASFEGEALLSTLFKFFTIMLGSVGLGVVIGCLTAVATKFTRVRDSPLLETSLFFLMSYTSYLLAEICEMSGIVAVLFCGIFQAHYTFHNLSLESKQRTKQLFEALNFMAENFIFCYIGVSMFTFSKHRFEFVFIFGAFVAIAVARAFNIYPLIGLANLGRRQKIPLNYQHMLWFSGLRGAMSFALSVRNTVSDARQMFFTTTCLISIVTVIFCGGMSMPMLTLLDIPVGVLDEEREELLAEDHAADSLESHQLHQNLSAPTSEPGSHKRSWLARIWRGFDVNYMKPMLTSQTPSLIETMPPLCGPFARCFTSDEQRHADCAAFSESSPRRLGGQETEPPAPSGTLSVGD